MRRWIILAGLGVSLLLAGCGQFLGGPSEPAVITDRQLRVPEGQVIAPESFPTPAPPAVGGAPEPSDLTIAEQPPVQSLGRYIISQASMTIYAEVPEFALAQIEDLAIALGGFISNSTISRFENQIQAFISIRVPAQSFQEARRRIRDLAQEVASDQVSGQDVTEEFVDLQARLRNLEATEAELIELLDVVRQRTQSAAEIMAIFNELTRIREQIEQVKGRLNYLENLVTFATLSVQILPPPTPQPVEFTGEVETVEGRTFVVNDMTVVLADDAEVIGVIEEGAIVEVKGILQRDGSVSASRVRVAEVIAGEVESIQGRTLVVNGTTIYLGPGTEIIDTLGRLEEGSQVEVHAFAEEDDLLLAARVKVTKPAPAWNPGRTARQALEQLSLAAQGIANLAIWGLFFLLPTALLLGWPILVAFGGWTWYRRRRRAAATPPVERPLV